MRFANFSLLMGALWVAVSGGFTVPNLALGTLFGAACLFFVRLHIGKAGSTIRIVSAFSLAGGFAIELMLSSIKIAALILRPKIELKPGIFAFETTLTKNSHVTLLANLITLTPGTLTVDISPDGTTLYIHAIDCSNVSANRAAIRNGFECKIREAFGDNITNRA